MIHRPLAAALALGLAIALGPRPAAATAGVATDPVPLYARHCAVCHGPAGRGDGLAAGLLAPRPRDFTSGIYKFRSTPSGALPTVDDVVATVSRGLPGTSMPPYADLLAAGEIERLARFVLSLAPPAARSAAPLALGPPPAASAEARARGAALYARVGCGSCHGADGSATGWQPPREEPGLPPRPADLSEPWAFRGGRDAASVARRVLTGVDGSGMPGYAGIVTPAEAWQLAYHVAALARRPAWEEPDPGRIRSAGVATDPVDRGRYLVNAMLCPLCHTPISAETGAYDTRRFLAGGMRVTAYPWGTWYSRNLTPDPATGLGGWSDEEIVAAFTRGIARDGRRLDPMAMPWPWFSRLTAADARAVVAYLRRLPPARNPVPGAERASIAEGVGGKLIALLGAEVAVEFWGGNAAADPGLREGMVAPAGRRGWALALGWGLLLAGAACLARAWRARRRALWVGLGTAVLVGWGALAVWPPLGLMSPEATVTWLFMGTPALPAALSETDRAFAERGEYVATIAPCGLCHTPAGAFVGFYTRLALAGGMEARWRVYGSAVSPNLTGHPRGGLGGMSDTALGRAMSSGIGRDGRAMHWQAMPWDIGSHWSVEDQRALIAYLRRLPPVAGAAPPPRGPRPGDPAADAFYFGDAIRR